MPGSEECWPPTYIATVEYGREEFAENELGDSLFPLDPGISICRTSYGGVLLVRTAVTDEELVVRTLSTASPSSLRRLLKVIFCCNTGTLEQCINANLGRFLTQPIRALRVSRRSGIARKLIDHVLTKELCVVAGGDSGSVLSVEPLGSEVCFTYQVFTKRSHR